jgi:uncharacterized membrane protein
MAVELSFPTATGISRRKNVAVATLSHERVNIGKVERWLSMVAGGALAAYGLKRREVPGGAAAVAAAALLYRGATGHCDLYQALGVNRANGKGTGVAADRDSDTRRKLGGARGLVVEDEVTIDRPLAEIYRFWRNFENLPRFLAHLESVAEREEGISHWVATGPGGMKVEWDARIINEIDNKLIAWQSLKGSMIATAGSVNFRETDCGTLVKVRMQYHPPGGKVAAAVAWMLGEEPGIQVREDLRRLKMLLETETIQ